MPHSFSAPSPRRSARGFTLVELMVAMTGGLFLSIVVFAVSRDASRFYQRELRVANATITGVSGFERLVSDLSRAGYLSTPNIQADPRVCNRPDSTWPQGIRTLRAVAIETDVLTDLGGTEVVTAGYKPDGLVVSGSFETAEELYTNTILPITGSAGFAITLNLLTPSAKRLGLTSAPGASDRNNEILSSVFMKDTVGRIVRVRRDGQEQYAVVSGTVATDTTAVVNLAQSPSLMVRQGGAGAVQCGLNDEGKAYGVSVVSIVRYRLRSMVGVADYKYLFDASGKGQVPFEDTRAELTRVELDATGSPIPGTLEIVAEYAVDLQLTPWAAGVVAAFPTATPEATFSPASNVSQALRGMNVLLSVRSREATIAGVGASDHHQIKLPTTSPEPNTYARLRTFQSAVPLRNLENANW